MKSIAIIIAVALLAQSHAATLKGMKARGMAAAGLPDPKCSAGVISLPLGKDQVQSCCAGYCGECSDYPTCKSVNGQDSENACCATKVYEMRCGAGAPANTCLKPCSESVPPCILDFETPLLDPPKRNAASNCTMAVNMNRVKMEAAIKAGQGVADKYTQGVLDQAMKDIKKDAHAATPKELKKLEEIKVTEQVSIIKKMEPKVSATDIQAIVKETDKLIAKEPSLKSIDIPVLVNKVTADKDIKDIKIEPDVVKAVVKDVVKTCQREYPDISGKFGIASCASLKDGGKRDENGPIILKKDDPCSPAISGQYGPGTWGSFVMSLQVLPNNLVKDVAQSHGTWTGDMIQWDNGFCWSKMG